MKELTKVEDLQRDRDRLIRDYLSMQDEADAINERIYQVCLSIEALNLKIEEEKVREEKALVRKSLQGTPTNGHSLPPGR
jgi:predicted  nucleic acid-binding Zn-ribbon protein